MAKLITAPVKITLEAGDTRQTYTANYASLSGNGDGLIGINVNSARLIDSHTTKKADHTTVNPTRYDRRYIETPAPSAEEQGMIRAAKAQERAALEAARIIEAAQQEAEAVINDVDHRLNLATLAYLQTGKTPEQAASVLIQAGIRSTGDRARDIEASNLEDLYLIDSPEFLKVV